MTHSIGSGGSGGSSEFTAPALPPAHKAAIGAARAILGAYDRKVLTFDADYLAGTIRMLIDAIDPPHERATIVVNGAS